MSKIEWTDQTWNPVTGCTKISAGCKNCYAERMSKRLRGRFGYPEDDPFRVTYHEDRLRDPWYWKKPRRVFVCSMGDLFHEAVPFDIIADVFDTIQSTSEIDHAFQVLTKRPHRAAGFFANCKDWYSIIPPVENVWIGTSIENQETANERIPHLEKCPAYVRFLSIEPLLGPIDLSVLGPILPDWIIIGCESGPRRRPCSRLWAEDLVRQCHDYHIPIFVKQLPREDGTIEKMPKIFGRVWDQYPA